jgi:alpha-tubulin suppressor-like RCC1 family protein
MKRIITILIITFSAQMFAQCLPPTQFWVNNITSTTASLNWIPSTSAPNGGYLFVYDTTPTVGGTDGNTLFTTTNLNNLLPNTTYYWWVASNCVTSQSDWALGGSFTTLPVGCWLTISAGITHSLGIKTDGTLWAWGNNGYGQLGDGTNITRFTPTQIGTSNDWQEVSAGQYYSVALKINGTLWTWGGYNLFGQLGDGTTNDRNSPLQIGTATNWQSISASKGGYHTLATKTNGTLWGWGNNGSSQLGDGTTTNKTTPTQIGSATNWLSVDAGVGFTLAIKTTGTLWAWGANGFGNLGDGTYTSRIVPTQIGILNDWSNVSAGFNHSAATRSNNLLYTWGNNSFGQLGDGTTIDKIVPTMVFQGIQSVDAGSNNLVGTTTFGNMWACGYNAFGQLGIGNITNSNSIIIGNATDHQIVSTGGDHTLSVNVDGFLKACGANDQGLLGDGTSINRLTLVPIACPTSSLVINDFTVATNDIKAFPNPVNNVLNLSSETTITKVSIFNLLGQEIITKAINANEGTIDISNLKSGTFFIKIYADSLLKTLKVIKN